ncbi:hypothetical protein KGF86_01835 [Ornithinibacillus massiliensis]|uniref:Uncharacterized protein n=1 Tax=Ornithinibacillus massiliensis TaxID=1944633 RepID=A0ABS5M9G6_9BACI|nr:hypothetical protein [Ornithinibacillus massiliensis]MBS3678945.1 hypothetical protein [Ornithinibacillus massiliensis]
MSILKYLGICTNFGDYPYITDMLVDWAEFDEKKIDCFLLDDIGMLDFLLKFIDRTTFSRVLVYDIEEIDSLKNLKSFSNICRKYNLEWSIIRQDLHSDVAVEPDYLLKVV